MKINGIARTIVAIIIGCSTLISKSIPNAYRNGHG
jgi:hypothetical protein